MLPSIRDKQERILLRVSTFFNKMLAIRIMECVIKHAICIFLCLLLTASVCYAEEDPGECIIHFLDVGQGDAAIIQCGGQTLMIDGGDKDSNQFVYSYLKVSLHLNYLDYIIATHPHDDHVKGLATALVGCKVGTVYSPVTEYDGEGFGDFLKQLSNRNATITVPHRGDTFMVGGATVTFLSEPKPEWDMNDQSLVVKIQFGNTSFIFTGDAAWDAEQDLLNSSLDLKADLLKIGHHGSVTSSCQAFLEAVKPTYAIISVGSDNKYGHPAQETLMRLQHIYASVFRTDKHGTIICISNGETLGFKMSKKSGKW